MYVSPSPSGAFDGFAGASVSSIRGSGYGVTDSAALLAPGTSTPSYRATAGGFGIGGSYDATALFGLPSHQGLLLSGDFDYARENITLGSLAGLAATSAGSAQTDTYRLGGSVLYRIGGTYVQGTGAFDFDHGNETQNVDASTGSFNFHGYAADLRLGNIFVLFNSISSSNPGLLTQAPDPAGGYAVGLDLSGHVGYSNLQFDSFTDSSGFVYGTGTTHTGDAGARARLFAILPGNGWSWVPYVAATIDQEFDFSSSLNIPSQAALAGGDLISLTEAQTYLGAQLGLDLVGAQGVTVGINGFYAASSDTKIGGGRIYLKLAL
jgi:hypothetical protein